MKNALPTIALFFAAFSLHAQYLPKQLFVVATSLQLRAEPGLKSNVLASMSNGEPVELIEDKADQESSLYDRIGGIQGRWLKIRYKGKTGFAFSPYLAPRYSLFYEHSHAEYLPKVNHWYGIYKKKNGEEEIREIKVSQCRIPENDVEEEHQYLCTDQRDTSLFVIATNEVIRPGYAGVFSQRYADNSGISLEMRPGTECWLFWKLKGNTIDGQHFQLYGTGTYSMQSAGLQLTNYKVMVAQRQSPGSEFRVLQDLTPFFSYIDSYVKVVWVGDLDRDDKPDLILQACSTQSCTQYLFLSSEAGEQELLRCITSYSWYDEC